MPKSQLAASLVHAAILIRTKGKSAAFAVSQSDSPWQALGCRSFRMSIYQELILVLFGFDPGGINSFGWAVLHIDDAGVFVSLKTGVVSTAPDAVKRAGQSMPDAPDGVGIDAPLFWVEKGDRRADAAIRRRVVAAGGQSGTVSSVNSLRGACVVQGVLAARLIADSWPSAVITEAHPKALLRLYTEAQRFVAARVSPEHEEHARDAALSAFAAWAAVSHHQGWRNIVLDESAPFFPSGKEVSYWFPDEQT